MCAWLDIAFLTTLCLPSPMSQVTSSFFCSWADLLVYSQVPADNLDELKTFSNVHLQCWPKVWPTICMRKCRHWVVLQRHHGIGELWILCGIQQSKASFLLGSWLSSALIHHRQAQTFGRKCSSASQQTLTLPAAFFHALENKCFRPLDLPNDGYIVVQIHVFGCEFVTWLCRNNLP